ncbi:MAG: RluA family pseudouridine synthase [Clostridiaceae bacterium]|nr:RluA family pseudouridine synthase [Clostridiaceae bacterium]
MKLSMTVTGDDSTKTVKQLLKGKLHLSERLVKKLKMSGRILLNSVPVHINAKASQGDVLEVLLGSEEQNDDIVPENMDLDIIYEDDWLIAINKPPHMVVHPTFRHFTGTVANGLKHYLLCKGVKTLIRPVSRLDKDTSGIIVFALDPFIQHSLIRQMSSNLYTKEYIGIVHGRFTEPCGKIQLPIERVPGSIMLRHTSPGGAPSVTHYEVMEQFDAYSLLKFRLETGRTHQIRVHCQAVGHPLLGDTLYGLPGFEDTHGDLISRQALHSLRTVFNHPVSGLPVVLESSIPDDISNVLEILRK